MRELRILLLPVAAAFQVELRELYDRTLELAQLVAEELRPLGKIHGDLPQSDSRLQEMISHAWSIPDVEETVELQYQLLDIISQARKLIVSPNSIPSVPRRQTVQQARAMLSAIEASVPICRTNRVCIVDKMSMMMWRLAEGGAEDLLTAGFEWPFFGALQPFLPAHARWETPWQCPTTLWPGIEARPVWTLDNLPEGSAARRLFLALRENAGEIAQDLQEGVKSQEGMALIKDPAWTGLSRGKWVAYSLFRSGGFFNRHAVSYQLDPLRCRLTPRTCRILREAGIPPGMTQSMPALQGAQEVVDFLRADPGTTVSFHAASTNSRLTVQVCLAGCSGEPTGDETGSFVQAGPQRQYYRFGQPVVFDDSFLHRVVVDAESPEPRWVLSIQVLHPKIDTPEGFASHFAYQSSLETDLDDIRDEVEQGGPLPPALGDDVPSAFPSEALTFHCSLPQIVLLYYSLWGPDGDGPEVFLSEIQGIAERPHRSSGIVLPPLAHRTKLIVRSVTDGEQIGAWRVDARPTGRRRFELEVS